MNGQVNVKVKLSLNNWKCRGHGSLLFYFVWELAKEKGLATKQWRK